MNTNDNLLPPLEVYVEPRDVAVRNEEGVVILGVLARKFTDTDFQMVTIGFDLAFADDRALFAKLLAALNRAYEQAVEDSGEVPLDERRG